MRVALIVTLACALAISGCGRKKRVSPGAPLARILTNETGLASWYGHPYHGRPAANGEIYDMEKLTAAHRTLPFGTWVRVTIPPAARALKCGLSIAGHSSKAVSSTCRMRPRARLI